MAIRTTDLTFADLPLDRFPAIVAYHAADIAELLPTDMIEIKAPGVTFPTVHTRMQSEIVHEPFALCGSDPGIPL
jgi:hypothetical protein